MYVETDISTTVISREYLKDIQSKLPELPEEKKIRILKQYNLSDDIASQLVRLDRVNDFEYIMESSKLDPITVGSTLAYTLKEIKREGFDIEKLNNELLKGTFSLVEEGKITKESVSNVLVELCQNGGIPEQTAINLKLVMLSNDDVESIIDELIEDNYKMIKERGMGSMGALMGKSMEKLRGKADGKLVNKLLKEKIQNIM